MPSFLKRGASHKMSLGQEEADTPRSPPRDIFAAVMSEVG